MLEFFPISANKIIIAENLIKFSKISMIYHHRCSCEITFARTANLPCLILAIPSPCYARRSLAEIEEKKNIVDYLNPRTGQARRGGSEAVDGGGGGGGGESARRCASVAAVGILIRSRLRWHIAVVVHVDVR